MDRQRTGDAGAEAPRGAEAGAGEGEDRHAGGAGARREEADGRSGAGHEEPGEGAAGGEGWHGPFAEIQEAVTDLVEGALRGIGRPAPGRAPRSDLVRVPGEGYRLFVDLPGVTREALEVTTVGDELTVSGERTRPELPEGAETVRAERGRGSLRRTFRLPADVDPSDVRARLRDGVLEVRLPRRAESRAQRVEVEV